MNQDKLDYFIDRTEKDIQEIKEDVKAILNFRAQIIGGAVVISSFFSIVITLIGFFIGQKFGV
jgi:hypothetical protein